ncbi:MFS transporter small subunit [Arthrobacter sp. MAHUQ-56]
MSTVPNNSHQTPANPSAGKLAVGWALVGVPLAYGVYETLTRVAALFG